MHEPAAMLFQSLDLKDSEPSESLTLPPLSADLYELDGTGKARVAKNISQTDLRSILAAFNAPSSGGKHMLDAQNPEALVSILRFESIKQNNADQGPMINVKDLLESLDKCSEGDSYGFTLRPKSSKPHCKWSRKDSFPSEGVECIKFSYSLPSPDGEYLVLCHHFHHIEVQDLDSESCPNQVVSEEATSASVDVVDKTNIPGNSVIADRRSPARSSPLKGQNKVSSMLNWKKDKGNKSSFPKDIIRGVAFGLSSLDLEGMLYRAISSEQDFTSTKSPPPPLTSIQKPLHPQALVLGFLENFEAGQRKRIDGYGDFMETIEVGIKAQQNPSNKGKDGLAQWSIRLSKTSITLDEIKPKLHYLTTSISVLENYHSLRIDPMSLPPQTTDTTLIPIQRSQHWDPQLMSINGRILQLKGKCEQSRIDVETLQRRMTGNLLMVSNLLAQKENDWNHEAEKQRFNTAKYQIEMVEKQEILALRSKRDSTIMKGIAILTALFLPGTFMAILFTAPLFGTPEEPVRRISPKTYFAITGSIAGVLLAAFTLWLIRLQWIDYKSNKQAREDAATKENEEIKEMEKIRITAIAAAEEDRKIHETYEARRRALGSD